MKEGKQPNSYYWKWPQSHIFWTCSTPCSSASPDQSVDGSEEEYDDDYSSSKNKSRRRRQPSEEDSEEEEDEDVSWLKVSCHT